MTSKHLAAWGVLAFILLTGAELESTAALAVAFAYLILLSVLLTVGPAAFDNVNEMVKG